MQLRHASKVAPAGARFTFSPVSLGARPTNVIEAPSSPSREPGSPRPSIANAANATGSPSRVTAPCTVAEGRPAQPGTPDATDVQNPAGVSSMPRPCTVG
jgi:hypothetical protein